MGGVIFIRIIIIKWCLVRFWLENLQGMWDSLWLFFLAFGSNRDCSYSSVFWKSGREQNPPPVKMSSSTYYYM